MLLFLASTSEKKTLKGRRYHSRQAVGAAVFQCLKGVPKKDYAEAFDNYLNDLNFVLVQRVIILKGCIRVLR